MPEPLLGALLYVPTLSPECVHQKSFLHPTGGAQDITKDSYITPMSSNVKGSTCHAHITELDLFSFSYFPHKSQVLHNRTS